MMVTMAITQVEPNNNLDSNSPLLTKIKIEEGEYGEGVPEVSSSCQCLWKAPLKELFFLGIIPKLVVVIEFAVCVVVVVRVKEVEVEIVVVSAVVVVVVVALVEVVVVVVEGDSEEVV